jgi:hypothetical protein
VVTVDFAAACSQSHNKTIIAIPSHVNFADAQSALSGNEKVMFVYTTLVKFLTTYAALDHHTFNRTIWTLLKYSSHMLHILQCSVFHGPGFSFSLKQFQITVSPDHRLYSSGNCTCQSFEIPAKMLDTHP